MKLKIAAYSKAKGNMQAIERKATYADGTTKLLNAYINTAGVS